ncbi:hypothetical protein [Brevifollis gellanilyticus]|uniref:Uncharacterized protein n=1 Tax=Brevifollis gellanilyticus TaxID=748831 RepID=A0A512M492_9BACT|nr:hypothetical protein [Brevifollis gellanilyticus]GEP41543.1 hypothetical protein BGE01nite_08340 [Brevifollis gellanilyticus]
MRRVTTSLLLATALLHAEEPRQISGIYPSLAMFNDEGECGTGAVVPWADRLWVITYGPHLPFGSSDKLYEVTPELTQVVRPESVGGTPANRMIHPESKQLFIGPYIIDAERKVRVIPPARMPGRLTGNARHLTDPSGKIYYATMEEGLYEVDVKTLAVKNFIRDGNPIKKGFKIETQLSSLESQLPGYHGKGLYTSQGRVIYANNGDRDKRVLTDPTTPSGALGEWSGEGDWKLVRRNQFTEVTGPGGIEGSDPNAPAWSIGWDAKSLILMLLDRSPGFQPGAQENELKTRSTWQSFRLPKVSHSYDGAHGWNTEWPRIRDIGEKDLLMTMHGAFWSFPKTFSTANTSGIRARSAYMKVIGDFARWNDRLVFGCDDSAKSEFLNKRKVKGHIDSVGQSQSNLWFVNPDTPSKLGPAHASGAVWLHDSVKAGDESDPFLIAGWKHRSAWHIDHTTGESKRIEITSDDEWLRVKAEKDCKDFSVIITLSNGDDRGTEADAIFDGIARIGDAKSHTGVFRPRGENKRTLSFAADAGYYEMGADLKLAKVDDTKAETFVKTKVAIPQKVITLDEASVLIVDDRGRRWRLPRASKDYDAPTNAGDLRICREVATERDMLSACGTFFELPAENADGFAKIRPISSHNLRVTDFGGYRGLFLISGVNPDAKAGEHIIRSDDGKAALWAGAIDDLWKLGKPRGEGGPWKNTKVKAGTKSDSYLMWGYDQRTLTLSHDQNAPVNFHVELDLTGTGVWVTYQNREVSPGEPTSLTFEPSVQARWLRVTASDDCEATAQLKYE